MRRNFLCIILLFVLCLSLAACSASGAPYEEMRFTEEEGSVCIIRADGARYIFYGFISGRALTGEQIGVLDGDENHRVYRVKGYDEGDWLLERLDVFMAGQTYSLFRAEHVTDIPADFALDPTENSYFLQNYL